MKRLSKLVPEVQSKKINIVIWHEHIPYEGKWELWDGIPFDDDGLARDKLVNCLVYSMGLQHFVEMLPVKSKELLYKLLSEDGKVEAKYMNNKNKVSIKKKTNIDLKSKAHEELDYWARRIEKSK
jgi:hypothetical protein